MQAMVNITQRYVSMNNKIADDYAHQGEAKLINYWHIRQLNGLFESFVYEEKPFSSYVSANDTYITKPIRPFCQDIVACLINTKNLTISQIARQSGVSTTAVKKIYTGTTQKPSNRIFYKLLRFYAMVLAEEDCLK